MENFKNFIKLTMVVDITSSLSLDEIMKRMSVEIGQKPSRRQVHDSIIQLYPSCDFKKTSGHKKHSPIRHYKLRWLNIEEKKAAASILLCMGTDFEMASLSGLIKMPEDLDIQDYDVKMVKLGFSLQFRQIIVLAKPSDRGMSPMYSLLKLLLGMLSNLNYVFKTGSCLACLDMGTIVIGTRDISGLVCKDPCSEKDWMVGPGLPSEALTQASYQAANTGLKVYRSAVQTGSKYTTEPTALPYDSFQLGIM